MDLAELQARWDALGRSDPLWAVLTDPAKRGNRWDPLEFFAQGEAEIDRWMEVLGGLGLPRQRESALDFGCGVGRLTQALARHFDNAHGVDIAPSMIDHAWRLSRLPNCYFVLNEQADLSVFGSGAFNLIYSSIVFQHMEPRFVLGYIREFLRLLTPGGTAVFTAPSRLRPGTTTAALFDRMYGQGPSGARNIRPKSRLGSVVPRSVARSVLRITPPALLTTGALPRSAYRAQIEILDAPLSALPHQVLLIRATIRNRSSAVWPSGAKDLVWIRAGNHWLDEKGETVAFDDGRADLPADLPPGSEAEVTLCAVAPPRPGRYLLEIDLVQEGVGWFSAFNGVAARCKLEVVVPEDEASPACYAIPEMEMHATPRRDIEAVVGDCGGRIVDVIESPTAGPDWITYSYIVCR